MNISDMGDSLIVRHFREFYHEVIRLKGLAGINAPAVTDEEIIAADGITVAEVRNRLIVLLEQQQRVAAKFGGDYIILYDDARYVMSALADEIFLHAEWIGRVTWNFDLIERYFYHTHVAGEMFFDRVDRLLLSPREGGQVELAKIYLMALCLGFQGKYRGTDEMPELDRYRQRLYIYVFAREDRELRQADNIFSSAGDFTMSRGERKLLPPFRRWIWSFVILLLVALGAQHVAWKYGLTGELWEVVTEILEKEEEV